MRVAYPGDATSVAARLPLTAHGDVLVASATGEAAFRIALGDRRDNAAMRALIGQQRYRNADIAERKALALHYGLLCKETAAVLVKRRSGEERNPDLPEIVRVPQMLPQGMLSRSPLSTSTSQPHCSDEKTGYLSIPAFLRRSADMPCPPPAKPVLEGEARDLLEAIYQTLLGMVCAQPETLSDTETLIRAIPKPLQPQARRLLRAAGPLRDMLHQRRIVLLIRSLGRLLAMPMPDGDQETALAVAAALHAKRAGKDIDWWKGVDWWAERLAQEWQVPSRSS